MAPAAMTYLPKQQQDYKPPLIANENAYLGDVATSDQNDSEKPVSCGFYRLEKGESATFLLWPLSVRIALVC